MAIFQASKLVSFAMWLAILQFCSISTVHAVQTSPLQSSDKHILVDQALAAAGSIETQTPSADFTLSCPGTFIAARLVLGVGCYVDPQDDRVQTWGPPILHSRVHVKRDFGGSSNYATSIHPVEHDDSVDGWSIWRVTSRQVPSVSLSRLSFSQLSAGDHIFALRDYGEPQRNCVIQSVNEHDFDYRCPDYNASAAILYSEKSGGLVGIKVRDSNGSPKAFQTGVLIEDIRAQSTTIRSIGVVTSPDQDALENIDCQKAYRYAQNDDKMGALSEDGTGAVAAFINACSLFLVMKRGASRGHDVPKIVVRARYDPTSGYEYLFNMVEPNEDAKIINLCWQSGDQAQRELLSTYEPNTTSLQGRFNWDNVLGCSIVDLRFSQRGPFYFSVPKDTNWEPLRQVIGDLTDSAISAWDRVPNLAPMAEKSTTDGTVTVGTLHTQCLASWDDSFQLHSTKMVITWNYQALKTTMKKLSHCIQLTVMGPLDVKDIAQQYVKNCIDNAINDEATIHIVEGIIALGVDVLSEGTTGGSATAAAVADYILSVKEKSINCLTDSKKIESTLAETLKSKFDAEVHNESHWVYWEL